MLIKDILIKFAITFAYFIAVDFSWLFVMSKKLYSPLLGHLMAEKPQLMPALIFYLLFVIGLLIFVIIPSISQNYPLSKSLLLAALFGLVTYATYDLTNQATLKNWPVIITIIDILWGTTLSAMVTFLSLLTIKKIG